MSSHTPGQSSSMDETNVRQASSPGRDDSFEFIENVGRRNNSYEFIGNVHYPSRGQGSTEAPKAPFMEKMKQIYKSAIPDSVGRKGNARTSKKGILKFSRHGEPSGSKERSRRPKKHVRFLDNEDPLAPNRTGNFRSTMSKMGTHLDKFGKRAKAFAADPTGSRALQGYEEIREPSPDAGSDELDDAEAEYESGIAIAADAAEDAKQFKIHFMDKSSNDFIEELTSSSSLVALSDIEFEGKNKEPKYEWTLAEMQLLAADESVSEDLRARFKFLTQKVIDMTDVMPESHRAILEIGIEVLGPIHDVFVQYEQMVDAVQHVRGLLSKAEKKKKHNCMATIIER